MPFSRRLIAAAGPMLIAASSAAALGQPAAVTPSQRPVGALPAVGPFVGKTATGTPLRFVVAADRKHIRRSRFKLDYVCPSGVDGDFTMTNPRLVVRKGYFTRTITGTSRHGFPFTMEISGTFVKHRLVQGRLRLTIRPPDAGGQTGTCDTGIQAYSAHRVHAAG